MFIELLQKRRSIRRFEDRSVEKEKIDAIIEAALRSPTSRSFNPWEFIVITDRKMIANLSKAKTHGSNFLENATLAIVVAADPQKSDVWVEDASIASIFIHLQAADLGLGSCWIQIRLREHSDNTSAEQYVAERIGLKEGMVVESIIAIGYPAEQKEGHPESSLLNDKVSYGMYGQKER